MRMLSIVILVSLCSTEMVKLFTVVDYFIRYDHYVNVLCVNQDQPQLACNGKCQLKKKLGEEGDNAMQRNMPTSFVKILKLEAIESAGCEFFAWLSLNEDDAVLNDGLPLSEFLNTVFIPPERT